MLLFQFIIRELGIKPKAWGFVLIALLIVGCQQQAGKDANEPAKQQLSAQSDIRYVGARNCAACHSKEYELWLGSHHQLAMQVADEDTVLGDFDNARFIQFGLTSTFYQRDGKFFVRTDGPDGELREYEIRYTFGVTPLQQYLIEFPGGRYQALSIAWDTQPKEQGGQRWFHLYPDEKIAHDDVLHWTGLNQNWNHMCAGCHSTNLKKNYEPKENRFNTTWSEINVACEACHGPGSRHVAWAEQAKNQGESSKDGVQGLVVRLKDRDGIHWTIDPDTGNARRNVPPKWSIEIELCARCHSRRATISEDYVPGRSLHDTHLPALLEERLYHADGQIKDEVYVYGSFRQSKMYRAGVTCSDCHEPHSLKLRASGNAVCGQCHLPQKFDTSSHHFHKRGSTGASCVECHMPATTYMVVDPRRDHSIRIPRPDLSVKLDTPNACNQCHTDRSATWAADAVQKWVGRTPKGFPNFAEALHAGRSGAPAAQQLLVRLAADDAAPNIARATALSQLGSYLSPALLDVLKPALHDQDPMVRAATLRALEALEPNARFRLAHHLLQDSVRAVRIEAARILASIPQEPLSGEQRGVLEKAIDDYIAAQLVNADRPESHLNIGILYASRGRFPEAETAYYMALKLQSSFVQAYVNLADLYRLQQRDDKGEAALRKALEIAPQQGDVHHALGLLLVRQKRLEEAMTALAEAAKLRPEWARYQYVYAVALNSTGKSLAAIEVLAEAHKHHPNDHDVLFALVTFERDRGNLDSAVRYAEKLVELLPHDRSAQALLSDLRTQQER